MRGRAVFALLVPLLIAHRGHADVFSPPTLTGPVVDAAGMIDPRATDVIENYLRRLRDAGGSQVTVATVPDIGDLSIEEASIKTVEAWKLGGAKADDGVLLLIAAKQRRMRIEVGQGREGVLPDATASRIVREIISPRMRQGEVGRAVAEGVQAIVSYTDPEFAAREPFGAGRGHPHRESGKTRALQVLFWLLLLWFLLKGNRMFGAGVLTGGMMRGPLGGWGGGSDGSWSGGGGGFGGSGGSDDGWSGGGGGFSGGGASGEW